MKSIVNFILIAATGRSVARSVKVVVFAGKGTPLTNERTLVAKATEHYRVGVRRTRQASSIERRASDRYLKLIGANSLGAGPAILVVWLPRNVIQRNGDVCASVTTGSESSDSQSEFIGRTLP